MIFELQIKSIYSRYYTEASSGIPGQYSYKETSQQRRAVRHVSDLTGVGIDPRPTAPIAMYETGLTVRFFVCFSDVKLIQTVMLCHELKRICDEASPNIRPSGRVPGALSESQKMPLVLCGDFNSLPESGKSVYAKQFVWL